MKLLERTYSRRYGICTDANRDGCDHHDASVLMGCDRRL